MGTPRPTTNDAQPTTVLVQRPSRLIWSFFAFERFLRDSGLLFASGENPLLVAPNSLMRVQAFEHKLRRGNLRLGTVLGAYVDASQLVHQSLNATKRLQDLRSGRVLGKLNLTA